MKIPISLAPQCLADGSYHIPSFDESKPTAQNISKLLEQRAYTHFTLGTAPIKVLNDDANEYARAQAVEASVDRLWDIQNSIASGEEAAFLDHLGVCGRVVQNPPKRSKPKPKMPHQPPPLPGVVSGTHTFRFKQISGQQEIDLYTDDLAFLMCSAISSSTLTPVWSHLRVNEIKMWAPTQVLSGNVQDPKVSSLTWTGDFSPSAEKFSTSNVQTGVATLSGKPSRLIEAGKWQKIGQGANATKICKLVVPDQTIIDIRVSFIFRDEEASSITVTSTSMVVTTGNVYYLPADFYFGTGKLTPMALLTRT